MKKICLLSLLVVGVLMLIPIMANAQGNGAVVIWDDGCTVLDPNLDEFEVYDTVKVITPSINNTKNVSCHGDLIAGIDPPLKAVVLDYENTTKECCVNFNGVWLSTTQWHETITPSGNVSLTCHFKGGEQTGTCGGGGPQ